MLTRLSQSLLLFWKRAPALEAAFYLFLGASFSLISPLLSLVISLLFLGIKGYALPSPPTLYRFLIYGSILITMGGLYTLYFTPYLPQETVSGNAVIKILDKRHSTFFGKTSVYYKAHLILFEADDHQRYEHLECSFYLKPQSALRADCHYYAQSITLIQTASGMLRLKTTQDALFVPIPHTFSLVEWRYQYKIKAQKHLSNYIHDPSVLKFLSALTLGYLDSKTLSYEFSRVGLQHLLTISGFHFALLALFFSLLLKPLLPQKYRAAVLLILLTLYVIYLGPAPSVSRAWIAIFVYLLGDIFEIKASAFNSLGLAACVSFLDHPLCMTHMSFQLSYAATLGIIAFYAPCDRWLRLLIPRRPLSTIATMPLHEQLAYFFLVLLRKGLALDMAVNTLTLPLLFYQFGNFPLFSFFYNLIVPSLVTATLFLLLLGCASSFYTPLCSMIHRVNDLYTHEILSFISHAPRGLDLFLYIPNLSPELTVSALCSIFLIMLYYSHKEAPSYGIFKPAAAGGHRA